MRIFSLLLLSLLCSTLVFAQQKDRATQMMKTIEKEGWDKEKFLGNFEKDLQEAAKNNKNLTLSKVHIDRKTGIISATVKDAKGKTTSMDGTQFLTEIRESALQNTSRSYAHSFLPDWLCWLIGCDDTPTSTPPPTNDDMSPEDKWNLDQRRRAAGLPPLFTPEEYPKNR